MAQGRSDAPARYRCRNTPVHNQTADPFEGTSTALPKATQSCGVSSYLAVMMLLLHFGVVHSESVSLIGWVSDTLSQGYTELQSLVKCLDHRGIVLVLDTVCSQA